MEYYPLTQLTDYNPLWKVHAWCRRNLGVYYLYLEPNGNVEVCRFQKITNGEPDREVLEMWKDGERKFRDPRRPERLETLEILVG